MTNWQNTLKKFMNQKNNMSFKQKAQAASKAYRQQKRGGGEEDPAAPDVTGGNCGFNGGNCGFNGGRRKRRRSTKRRKSRKNKSRRNKRRKQN